MKKLKDILDSVNIVETIGSTDINIESLTFNSKEVNYNSLFIATKGTKANGHDFINTAIENGAKVIVCEDLPEITSKNITFIKVINSSESLGYIASNFYDKPTNNIKLIGVTGTNGKTTIATLLFNLFKKLGYKVGLFSTIKNYIHDKEVKSTHTTPDAIQLNLLLKNMVEYGCEYCFMEVSSHSIVQSRISGLKFTGGIFTNITHDHLDYHKTFDEYIIAKKLFFDSLEKDAFALTNLDDKRGEVMLQNTKASKYTYGLNSLANYKAKILENHFSGLLLNIDGNEIWSNLIGKFNTYNLLAIYSTARLLNQDKLEVLTALSSLEPVEGRFEYIIRNGITGIVDYAHTPDALRNVLNTINDIRTKNETLITVVGCGGDRDATKRPIMAKTACELSNKVILTSDNPRAEEPDKIIEDMKKGITPENYKKAITIIDRREAIKTAVSMSKNGDIILIAGKGHEDYQEVKGVKYHFDDIEVLEETLKLFE